MKFNRKYLPIGFSLIFIMSMLFVGSVKATEPTVEEIVLDPEDPVLLSTITFTATITNEEVLDDVRLVVQECNDLVCYRDLFNVSMENIADTTSYESAVTLVKDDATYIKYHIEIESDGHYYKYDINELDLKTETDNGNSTNGNNNDNGNDDKKSPGFEIISLLIAIIMGMLILRKKRL